MPKQLATFQLFHSSHSNIVKDKKIFECLLYIYFETDLQSTTNYGYTLLFKAECSNSISTNMKPDNVPIYP